MALIYSPGRTATDFGDGTSYAAWQPQNFLYGGHVDIPSSGTVTQLGVFAGSAGGAVGLKFGLYTSAGVLVAQSTGTVAGTGSPTWVNSGAISASVSAGRHYVLVSAANANGTYGWSTTGNGSYATEAYATAMQATETISVEAETNQLYGVRLDFTAGGGGAASFVPSSPAARLNAILLPNF